MNALADWVNSFLESLDLRAEEKDHATDELVAARRAELKRLRDELSRLWSVLRMTAAMTATLNYGRVLDMALDLGVAALADPSENGESVVGALLMFEDDELHIVSERGLTSADRRVRLPAQEGVLARALDGTEPQVTNGPQEDPELRRMAGLHSCRQVVCIPLGVGLEIYGALLFGHPERGFFERADRLELLKVTGQQAMIALQNARLYQELEQEKERISDIQEEARNKLARDLHDGPTQSISAIGMRVNFTRRLMERDPKAAADELFKIEELARRTTKEMRQMLFTLRPLVLESEGLIPALRHLAEKVVDTHGQAVKIEADQDVAEDLEVGKQGVLFFLAEEAVNNARKHAEADQIRVRLHRHEDVLVLDVVDDGKGFNVAAVENDYASRGSLGLLNLRERAELLNGVLKIDSAPGDGTRVRVIVPTSVEAAERVHRAGFAV